MAVTVWPTPTDSWNGLVVKLAPLTPADVVTPTVASVAAPSLNVTVPPGGLVPRVPGVMTAVKVTGCPNTDGFADDVRPVAVDALVTVKGRPADVLVS